MKKFLISLLILFTLTANAFAKAVPNTLATLQNAFIKLLEEKHYQSNTQLSFQDPKEHLTVLVQVHSLRENQQATSSITLQGQATGLQVDAALEGKFLNDGIYVNLKKSPVAKTDLTGKWFAIDLNLFKQFELDLIKQNSHEKSVGMKRLDDYKNLTQMTVFVKTLKVKPEKLNGISTEHFTLTIDTQKLLKEFLAVLTQSAPEVSSELKPLLKETALPPLPIQLWLGTSDHRIHQIEYIQKNVGDIKTNFDYKTKIDPKHFDPPNDAIDARALDLLPLSLFSQRFPRSYAFTKRNVDKLPGSKLYFVALTPYHGPSLEELRSFCGSQYGLDNIEILPSINLSDESFDAIRLQYTAEELLNSTTKKLNQINLSSPNSTLIVFTDKDLYSTQQSKDNFVVSLSQNNSGVLSMFRLKSYAERTMARTEKLLARMLGEIYWKFPPSALPQDPMYNSLNHLPEDLDVMGRSFLNDTSAPLIQQGISLIKDGKNEEARTTLLEAIHLNSLNPQLYLLLAKVDFELGNYQESIEMIDNSLFLDPKNEDAYYVLGENYEKTNNLRRALWEYGAVTFLNPKRIDASNRLSDIHKKLGIPFKINIEE